MYTSVPFQYTTKASTNLVPVSGTSGAQKLCSVIAINTSATADVCIKLYWAPQGVIPVVGTTVPTLTIAVAASAAITTAVSQTLFDFANPLTSNGQLWMWVTALPGAADTTATAAGDGIITLALNY